MYKKSYKKLIASVLSASLVFGQASVVNAAQDDDYTITIDESEIESADSDNVVVVDESDDASLDGSEEASEDASAEASSAEAVDEANTDATSEIEITKDLDISADDAADEASKEASSFSSEEATDGSSEGASAEDEIPAEIVGMSKGYKLSSEEEEFKDMLKSRDVLEEFEGLTEGVDYVEDEVICFAESEEHALEIARAYGGELKDYDLGVAVISLADTDLSVAEAYAFSVNSDTNIPAVQPNYIYHLSEPIDQVIYEAEENVVTEEAEETEASEEGEDEIYPESASDSEDSAAVEDSDITEDSDLDFSDEFDTSDADSMQEYEITYDENSDESVEENYSLAYNDPAISNPAGSTYQWFHDTVGTFEAWKITKGSSNVTVAVIDSGVLTSHPEFSGRIVNSTLDIFGNKNVDQNGHGTHVAGIIAAAVNNGQGGSGIAPGVKILPVRVLDASGNGTTYNITRGVNYVAGTDINYKRRADIANMSLGGFFYDASYALSLKNCYKAGVTVCVAMGNECANNIAYPAAYGHVIAVASVDKSGQKSYFSTYGSWADVAAPGSDIYSTYLSNGYASESGTSMATPVVAGCCALYMSAKGHVSPSQMEKVVKASVTKAKSAQIGTGIINAAKMLNVKFKATAPTIELLGAYSNDSSSNYSVGTAAAGKSATISSAVVKGSLVKFYSNGGSKVIYTTDGTKPSYSNGTVVNGTACGNGSTFNVNSLINNSNTTTKITVKAIAVGSYDSVSSVTTLTFTVDPAKTMPGSISILNAPKNLIAGKSIALSAQVTPAGASKKVTWSMKVASGSLPGAKITSSGKITTKAGQAGTLSVTCSSKENPKITKTVNIAVTKNLYPISSMKLSSSLSLNLGYGTSKAGTGKINITELTAVNGKNRVNVKGNTNYSFQWTTSDEHIAKISVDGNSQGVTVTAVGAGSATITCKALDGSGKTASCKVTVKGEKIVKSVSLTIGGKETKSAVLYTNSGKLASSLVITSTLKDANKKAINASPIWSTSNSKVASIAPNGKSVTVYAKSKGKATITCSAQDGSGKKASVTIDVKQAVTKITVEGQNKIAAGKKATYKAKVFPASATKTLKWTLSGAPSGVSVNEKNGAVTVAKNAPAGRTVKVIATATDGSGVAGSTSFTTVAATIPNVIVTASSSAAAYKIVKDKKNSIKSFQLYNMNYGGGNDERVITLYSNVYSKWTSSDPKVVKVGELGTSVTVTALAAGKSTITCTAQDGSNKKATISVNVVAPASSLEVLYKNDCIGSLAQGYSTKAVAVVGNAYGKATKKVTWSYEIKLADFSNPNNPVEYSLSASDQNSIKKSKAFFTFSNGTVKANSAKKFKKDEQNYRHLKKKSTDQWIIKVTATTADGTGISATQTWRSNPPLKWIYIGPYYNRPTAFYAYNKGTYLSIYLSGSYYGTFEVTSSNPNAISGCIDGTELMVTTPRGKTGSATITLKALDGSGKKQSIKIYAV